jgi:hypothetical protein
MGSIDSHNEYLFNHRKVRDWAIIFSSFFMDVYFLIITYIIWEYAENIRFTNALLVFYISRSTILHFFMIQFPDRWCFDDPGFFSIIVPYGRMSDFYFSGHSGFLVLSTLELIHWNFHWLAFLNLLSTLYTSWLLVATRAHYSIGKASSPRHHHRVDLRTLCLQNGFRV